MFYIIRQKDNQVIILDTIDNTKETVSLEFAKKLQNLMRIADISKEHF